MMKKFRLLVGTTVAGIVLVGALAIPALAAGPGSNGASQQKQLRTSDCTCTEDCTQDRLRLQDCDCTGDQIQDRTRLQDKTFSGDFLRQMSRLKDRTC